LPIAPDPKYQSSKFDMPLSAREEIAQLTRRLEILYEQAENELRQKLKKARAVVADLEAQLSEITGRPSASQIRAAAPDRWAPITDEQLEVQIVFVLQTDGRRGLNAAGIAGKLNQNPVRIRRWIKKYPNRLKREGAGRATRFSLPLGRPAPFASD
jgi:hypothetical protein